jgi:hypothetical protein
MKEITMDKGEYTNIIIQLNETEREKLVKKLEEISIEGGQFSWGYNIQDQAKCKNVVYFRKVKPNGELEMYSDPPSYKGLLMALAILFFFFMGIFFIISLLEFLHN